jgi:hypothetical protein
LVIPWPFNPFAFHRMATAHRAQVEFTLPTAEVLSQASRYAAFLGARE